MYYNLLQTVTMRAERHMVNELDNDIYLFSLSLSLIVTYTESLCIVKTRISRSTHDDVSRACCFLDKRFSTWKSSSY